MARSKMVRMTVTVRVPADYTAADARREVRTLINEQCNYRADPEDIRAVSVAAARAAVRTPED